MEMIAHALHVGISVTNTERALKWYEENLGFTLCKTGYAPPLKAKVSFIKNAEGFELELFEYDAPKAVPEERRHPDADIQTAGTKHVAFLVESMEAWKARFLENGADIAHEVQMGEERILFVRDPDGVLIELLQR